MSPGLLTLNLPGPVAVIGDVHGRADLLERLLEELGDLPVLVVGDLCDRGPDTRRVLDLLVARNARGVLGNHEEWFLRWANGQGFDSYALHPGMGGRATLASYGIGGTTPRIVEDEFRKVPREHARFLGELAAAIDLHVDGVPYWVVHAAPRDIAAPPLERIPSLVAAGSRDLRWSALAPSAAPDLGRTMIMGHVPLDQPHDDGRTIAIDLGAGRGTPHEALCAVVLPERRFVVIR